MGPLAPCAIFFLSRSCPDWACSSTNPSGEGAFLRRSDLLFCVSRSTCPAGPLLFQQAGCTFHSLNPPDEGPPRGGGRQFCFTFWASVASKTPGVLGCFECRCLQRRGFIPLHFCDCAGISVSFCNCTADIIAFLGRHSRLQCHFL